MAVPMTSNAFKEIVMENLNQVFDEVYDTHMGIDQYTTEVDFEETAIRVQDVRNNDDA